MGASPVVAGRHTAAPRDDDVVVLLIGMRFNHWWRIDKWLFVLIGMRRMLTHLRRREHGLLASHSWFGRTTMTVQYWSSMDALQDFAADTTAPHRAAWLEYFRRLGRDPAVGVYHEAYRLRPGGHEGIYVNMPVFGLAEATEHVPVDAARDSARGRVRYRRREPAPAGPEPIPPAVAQDHPRA